MKEHSELIKAFGQTLFNNGADPSSQRDALIKSTILGKSDPTSFSKPVQHLVVALSKFRAQLVAYYKEYVLMEPQDCSFFAPDIHSKCGILFENPATPLLADKTQLWPWDHITKLEKRT